MKYLPYALLALLCLGISGVLAQGNAQERVYTDEKGRTRINCVSNDPAFNNPWPADLEDAYWDRVNHAIKAFADVNPGSNTWGENEKDTYPKAMYAFLNGKRDAALKTLQLADSQPQDHAHTLGIDYYWCFTIKGQIRKYFFFGQYLDPAYRQRMYDAAKIFTEEEPLRRPHPAYGKGDPNQGVWGPENKGSWVDVRDTDNLRAMRDTTVYLLAEETGNEATRQLYKQKIRDYVVQLYNYGMREWDSENYHAHTLSPYHNLYDFAKDPEVKMMAKVALDWLYAAGAVKYWRGGFGGPNARDYGNSNVVFGGNATHPLCLYWNDAVLPDPRPDRDDVYQITSAYRPPMAVVELAKKNFARPAEIFATKSPYKLQVGAENPKPFYWETQYFANTYQMGSLVCPNPDETHVWNIAPFKLMAYNAKRGVDYFVVNTSPFAEHSFMSKGDQIGQYQNLLIWLRPAKMVEWQDSRKPVDKEVKPAEYPAPFYLIMPKSAAMENEDGIFFIQGEKTWLALRPINVGPGEEIILPLQEKDARGNLKENAKAKLYRDERFFKAQATGMTGYAGFALEVGEAQSYGSYAEFKQAVKTKSKLDLRQVANGTAELTGADGKRLKLTFNQQDNRPIVLRDGVARDWDHELDTYKPLGGNAPISSLGWQSGKIRVEAGGHVYTGSITPDGKATFENK